MSKHTPGERLREQSPAKQVPERRAAASVSSAGSPPPDGQHPAFGAMKGLLTAASDLDLTQPSDPERGES